MPNLRPILLISLVFLGYLLWVEWQKDYGPRPAPVPTSPSTVSSAEGMSPVPDAADLPALSDMAPAATNQGDLPPQPDSAVPAAAGQAAARQQITVTTDVLLLQIDPLGGTVTRAELLNYPVNLDAPDIKVSLLNTGPGRYAVAQSGLLSRQAAPNHTANYAGSAWDYALADGQDVIEVPLSWRDTSGVEVIKTFRVERGKYDVAVSHELRNNSGQAWQGSRYLQLQKAVPGDDEGGGGFNNPERYSFDGLGFYSPEDKLQKVDFEDAEDEPFRMTTADGWAAMIQHYFFSAWIPPGEEVETYSTETFKPAGAQRVIARAVAAAG